MAEAVRPRKKKKTRLQKKTEEPAPSTFSPTIRTESVSGMLCCLRMWTRFLFPLHNLFWPISVGLVNFTYSAYFLLPTGHLYF